MDVNGFSRWFEIAKQNLLDRSVLNLRMGFPQDFVQVLLVQKVHLVWGRWAFWGMPARKFLASSPLAEGSDIYSWLSAKSAGAHRKVTDYFGIITWNCQVMGTCNGHVVHALDKVSFCKSIPNTHAAGSRVVMGVCFASFCTVNVDRPPVLPRAQNVKIQQ